MLNTRDQWGACAPDQPEAPCQAHAAMWAPHHHLTEAEAVALLADRPRPELLRLARTGTFLARHRDGRQGHELPNRNALVIAGAALVILLCGGPRVAAQGGAA